MSCLLPHFKCQPDTFSLHSKPTSPPFLRVRDSSCLRAQCVISTTPQPTSTADTAVLDTEKLRMLCVDANSSSTALFRSLTSAGAMCPPSMTTLDASLAKRTLIEDEDSVISAAASEAVALARAAAKLAKDAAMLAGCTPVIEAESESESTILQSESQSFQNTHAELLRTEQAGCVSSSVRYSTTQREGYSVKNPFCETGDVEPTGEELSLLEAQIYEGIAVRSVRQTQRKARKARAEPKAFTDVVRVKKGSSSRKKQTSSQDVDYSDPLRYLKGSTSSSKLLTATEELELSAGIQDLLKLEKLQEELQEKCGCEPSFAQWAAAAGADQKTLRKRLNYGIMCKDKMIKSNVRLVISIAKNYQGSGMNLQDLVQEGCRGLIRGAEKFDASKGFKFSTYAHWWIKQAVRRSLSDLSRTIRLPFHMVEASYRVREARKQLYSESGRHPDNDEVAEAAGLSIKRLNAVLLTPKAPRSLDQKIGFDQNLRPSDMIADPQAETSEDLLMKQFMKKDLEKVLNTLTEREKQVIRWRFGMEDGRTKTLQEIGELMGVSRERIRQIETSAFRKLKNKKRTQHLEQYLL